MTTGSTAAVQVKATLGDPIAPSQYDIVSGFGVDSATEVQAATYSGSSIIVYSKRDFIPSAFMLSLGTVTNVYAVSWKRGQ
jgi:hypothetical protein